MRWYRVREYLLSSLWFVPILCVLAGAALSTGTIAVDRIRDGARSCRARSPATRTPPSAS